RGGRDPARDPPPAPEGDDVGALGRHLVEDRRPQPWRGYRRNRAEREARCGVVELGELLAALLALPEVALVVVGLVRVERVERVCGGQVVEVHDTSVPASRSISRRRESPPNILLLIVPSAWRSRSANSD